jgi:hypothetical protein
MPDLKYAVIFSAVDQLSDKLSTFGGGFDAVGDKVTECASKLGEAGESFRAFGERLSIDATLMKEGADHLRELSDAISEPAFAAQKALQTTAALTGLNAVELGKLKDTAVAFSNTHAGVTTEGWIGGFTRLREVYQDTNKAIAGEDTAAMLAKFGVDGEAATNLLGVAYRNLGVDAATAGDQFYKTMTTWGVGADHAQQLAQAVGQLGGTAAATHTSLAELFSIAGAASSQLGGGGRGGMMFASMIRELVDSGKSGADWSHGIAGGLAQIKSNLAGMPDTEKLDVLKKMGVSNPGAMLTFLDNLDKVKASTSAIASASGALGSGFATATGDAADRFALMHQNLSNLYDAMAAPALPWFSAEFGELTKFIQGATSATEKHSWATRDLVIGMSIASVGLGGAASALSTFGMATIGIGNAVKALSYAPTIFAALVSPIGLVAIGAAALAFAGYEIYEHWSGIESLFSRVWTGVENIVGNVIGRMKTAGVAMMKNLGEGILEGLEYPFKATWSVAEKLGRIVIGHSPPPEGPLHELGKISISDMIAERIQPAPVLTAIRRTAAAAAIASTTVIATGAGAAMAGVAPGASGGGIVVNAPITINAGPGANGDELEKVVVAAFEKHRYELLRALERRLAELNRTELK